MKRLSVLLAVLIAAVPSYAQRHHRVSTTYSISGTISGSAADGTKVTLTGAHSATTTTGKSGTFEFHGLQDGNYTVTASNTTATIAPNDQTLTIDGASKSGVNFSSTSVSTPSTPSTTSSAPATTYSISGTVSGPAADGTTVTLTGASSATATTGTSGTFDFSGLEDGTYTVTASSTTATIASNNQTVTIDNANQSAVNFTSTSTSTPSTPSTTSSAAFYDNFSGTTLSSNWIAQDVFPDVNNQVGCYLPSADTVNNALIITTTVQTSTCPGGSTQQYASGAVIWSTFSFTYGTVEFKAEMPGGQGTWPAVWLLGTKCRSTSPTVYNANSCNWPNAGSDEIDITEILDSNHTSVNQQVHSANSNAGCSASTSDVSQNYHVYDFIWTSESLTWEIDGKVTCTLPASDISATPKYLIINTALGGDSGGSISNSTLPQAMHVDYVQVTE